MAGARSIAETGALSIADVNLSSARARTERARLLAMRAKTGATVDWESIPEDFSQRVLEAERTGLPAVDLRTLPRPEADDEAWTR